MPSKHKPSFWQKVTHAPSQSYADAAPAHPSRPQRASPYGAPSTSLTASALAAAQQAQHRQPKPSSSAAASSAPASVAPGPRKQSLQYNEAASRFELVDEEPKAGGSDVAGTTQWKHPRMRKDGSRSDVGPVADEPPKIKKTTRRKVAEQQQQPAGGQGYPERAPAGTSKARRASSSDQRPPLTVVEHHHHHYHAPSPAGHSASVFTSSPSSSQLGSTSQLGTYAPPVAHEPPLPPPQPFHSAVVLPTPPSSDLGMAPMQYVARDLGRALDQALLHPVRPAASTVAVDSDSDDDAVFYTPRSSMTFEMPTDGAAAAESGGSEYGEDEARSPTLPAGARPDDFGAPVLTFQPPTPTTFPLANGESRSLMSPGQAPGQEKNLFSEHSFHPDQMGKQQRPPSAAAAAAEPAQTAPPDEYSPELEQPPRPAYARNSPSPSPPSSSPRMAALLQDDDDAYSGVLLYALAEEDEGGALLPALPPAPPRLPSIPHISPLATPSLTNLVNNPLSTQSSLSGGLRPGGAHARKAESIRSAASSSSRYSQTSYASYASELHAPRPVVVSAGPSSSSIPSNVSSPLSSPMRPTPSSSNYSRQRSSSPSLLKGPSFPSSSLDSPPSAPSSIFSANQQRNTPFLPRPTSALMHSFDMAGSYPSAPASVVSDSGHRPRRAQSNLSEGQFKERPPSLASYGPGASKAGFQRKRLMSEGASLRDVRSLPQVMGDSARGQGGTSMSGGAGYSSLTLPSAVYRPAKSPARYSGKVSYDALGIPDTTMAAIMVSSTARRPSTPSLATSSSMSSLLRRNSVSATPAHLLPTPLISVSYSAHTPPPKKLSSTSVLVRVWAVAVDGYDALAARDASPGFVPGRSFVGKVVEWGDACAGMFGKGEFVFGLRDLKRSGALSEFLVIERRYLAKAPKVTSSGVDDEDGLTLEDIAALPLLGVTAHRAVGGISRGARALVLLSGEAELGAGAAGGSDWGVGVLACQELVARGVIVVLQVTSEQGEAWARAHIPNLREGHIRVGDPLEIVNVEHEGSFDLVLDCVGGRRIYDASRRILSTGGQFTTLKGDTSSTGAAPAIPTAGSATNYRSLRRAFVKKDRKHVDYRVISPSGSGPIVDFMGEDVRDILEWISGTCAYRPARVAKVVPFERAPEAFAVRPRDGAKVASLQGSYECEEQVWGVRLVS